MSKTITREKIIRISQIIREWPRNQNIKWDLICAASELELGYIPTRQALSNKKMLSNAYKVRKDTEKKRYEYLKGVSVPKSLPAAIEQIVNLRKRIVALESEIAAMHEMAALFIMNASIKGLSKKDLMESPLKQTRKE